MENIPLPSKITVQEGKNENNSIFIIEPCYPGYGTTLGNALRRNILCSLPGASVISFKIKGAQHEFSSVPGVKEDLVDISLNLKQLRLKIFSEGPIKLELKAKGEKKVTAGDITSNSDVEIINKDLILFTITDKNIQAEAEIVVGAGRGYVTTESREQEGGEIGMIAIDANYTPITRVGFNIENMRVGQMTNWDRLILDIETDGTVSPSEAMHIALKDLIAHFNFVLENIPKISGKATVSEVSKETEEKEKPAKRGRKTKKEKSE